MMTIEDIKDKIIFHIERGFPDDLKHAKRWQKILRMRLGS